jgi:rubrerythrin
VGYSPQSSTPYTYRILTETGVADEIYESTLVTADEVDMPDELWTEGSGWADIKCDVCGTKYHERTRPGNIVACPICGAPEQIPADIILEKSHIIDD